MQAYQIQAKEFNGYLIQSEFPYESDIALTIVFILHNDFSFLQKKVERLTISYQ